LVERDGYDYRILSGGGRLGRVNAGSVGDVTISLSYSTFLQIQSTVYLYVKENYPLESRSESSLRNVTFSPTPTPTPTPIPIPTPTPTMKSPVTAQNKISTEEKGLRITYPSIVYMPQSAQDDRNPLYGYMKVEYENLNSSGYFGNLFFNIYSSVKLDLTGDYVIPAFNYSGPVNSGVKGQVSLGLSYAFFLGMKGPIDGTLSVCTKSGPGGLFTNDSDFCITASLRFTHKLSDLNSNGEAEAKAAAELKAKQEAEAKAAAELKAKQEAEAKAAAELKAKQEAEAKAAAELKAKQEAEAKAAAELKAKQEAEAKAAAELKAKQEAAALAAANKKITITCVKGKTIKKITAVKPKCPAGYKKK
jgi:hypothetical protein